MKKPFKVLASALLAGTCFSSTLTLTFAEWRSDGPIAVEKEDEAAIPSMPSNDKILPEELVLESEPGRVTKFTDVPANTELAHAVQFLHKNVIARGFGETFGVNDPIKRLDAAMIVGKYRNDFIAEFDDYPSAGFTDVPLRALDMISTLKWAGLMNGKTATLFGSYDTMTRGEAAIMLYNVFQHNVELIEPEDISTSFKDVSGRYIRAVHALTDSGITRGKSNTVFGTNDPLTRGQLALLLYRVYTKYYEK
ncbi:S-layer homology domain-containing protein [Domibacillus indicus]|uniref:S-layer homology domain-containing protein n=1 Tax=Domibacillus indicus TaxID=1437523 RepID=UPI0006180B72|nr:S-layer homology domain-containing protein [Domibacillus indicus]